MSESLDQEIRTLRAQFWARRDPEGRAFAPLADAYRRRGELDEAVSLIRDGLARIPDYATGYLVASRVARDRGDLNEARSHLDRVLELDPENVKALLDRAEMGLEEGDREGATRDLRALIALEPGNEEARVWLEAVEEAELLERREAAPSPDPGSTTEAAATGIPPEPAIDPEPALEPGPPPAAEIPLDAEITLEAGPGSDPVGEPEPPLGSGFTPLPEITLERDLPVGWDITPDVESRPDSPLEPESPRLAAGPEEQGPTTRTMADLYARQGLHERAVEVYRHLLERDPEDRELRERLDALLGAVGGARVPASGVPPGAGDTGEGEAAGDPARGDRAGRTISGYLGDLLAWVPGAVPIESLAPDVTEDPGPEGAVPEEQIP